MKVVNLKEQETIMLKPYNWSRWNNEIAKKNVIFLTMCAHRHFCRLFFRYGQHHKNKRRFYICGGWVCCESWSQSQITKFNLRVSAEFTSTLQPLSFVDETTIESVKRILETARPQDVETIVSNWKSISSCLYFIRDRVKLNMKHISITKEKKCVYI